MSAAGSTHAWAQRYIRLGYPVVAIRPHSKRPYTDGWERLLITEESIAKYIRPNDNLGIMTGELAGGLTDIDLDSPMAVLLAPRFLPGTDLISGRAKNPSSHWWYRSVDVLPGFAGFKSKRFGTLLEFRTTGRQTLVAPSTHPDGDAYVWEREGEPLEIRGDTLRNHAAHLAAATVLRLAWPDENGHTITLALAGALIRNGWDVEKVVAFAESLCHGLDDTEWARDRERAIRDTAVTLATGGNATGIPTLARFLGDDVVSDVVDWLGLTLQSEGADAASATSEDLILNPHRLTLPFVQDIADFLALDLPEPDWLIEDMLSEQTLNLYGAAPKTLKTFFVTEQHIAIATGTYAFGRYAVGQPRMTAYIQRELTASKWQSNLGRMLIGRGLSPAAVAGQIKLITGHRVRIDNPDETRRLVDDLLTVYPDLAYITFDTFKKSFSANENDNTEMDAVMDLLLQLRDEFTIAISLVHHTTKGAGSKTFEDAMRGAVVIWGSSDDGARFTLQDPQPGYDQQIKHVRVDFDGRNIAGKDAFFFRLIDTDNGGLRCEPYDGDVTVASKKDAIVMHLERRAGWATPAMVAEATSIKPGTVTSYLRQLAHEGRIAAHPDNPNRRGPGKPHEYCALVTLRTFDPDDIV